MVFPAAALLAWLFALFPTANLFLFCLLVFATLGAGHWQSSVGRTAIAQVFAIVWWAAILIIAFALASYRPDGFHYPTVFTLPVTHADQAPFVLRLNIGKLLAGVYLLWVLSSTTGRAVLNGLFAQLLLIAWSAFVIVFLAIVLLDLSWSPKPIVLVVKFAVVNLIATCIAEEIFFRLLLQLPLGFLFTFLLGQWKGEGTGEIGEKELWLGSALSLVLVTGLFIAVHGGLSASGQWVYGVAGFAYGLVFLLTGRLWAVIALHFLVNSAHFALLTYPI